MSDNFKAVIIAVLPGVAFFLFMAITYFLGWWEFGVMFPWELDF